MTDMFQIMLIILGIIGAVGIWLYVIDKYEKKTDSIPFTIILCVAVLTFFSFYYLYKFLKDKVLKNVNVIEK
jgi:phosphotransferase system  glucose/maltose/N-acetylglucosamine-specific IIC component